MRGMKSGKFIDGMTYRYFASFTEIRLDNQWRILEIHPLDALECIIHKPEEKCRCSS